MVVLLTSPSAARRDKGDSVGEREKSAGAVRSTVVFGKGKKGGGLSLSLLSGLGERDQQQGGGGKCPSPN